MAGRGKLLLSMMAKKKEGEEKATTTAITPPSTSPQGVAAPQTLIEPIRTPTPSVSTSEQTTAAQSDVSSPSLVRKPIPTSMPSPDRQAFRSIGRGMLASRPKEPIRSEKSPTSEEIQSQQPSVPTVQPQTTSPERPGIRAIGRGSILARQNRSPSRENRPQAAAFQPVQPQQQPPLTTVVSQQVSQPQVKSEQPVASVTESKVITPEAVLPPAQQAPPSPRLTGRGRGMLMSRVAPSVTPAQVLPAPQVQPPTVPITKPELTSVITTTTTIEKAVTMTTMTMKSQVSSSSAADESARSTQRPTTVLSMASTNKSMQRAMEELKIEHIARQAPVRRCGEAGTRQTYTTNYVRLKGRQEGVYQYVVFFDPPIDSQFIRVKLVTNGLKSLIGNARLFDGFTLFLPKLLGSVTRAQCERKTSEGTSMVNVTIQLTKILPPEYIPPVVFNIIFKNIMKELNMSRIGQHYFSPVRQINLVNQNLQIWPGYTTAVHEQEDGLYLVVDVAHKVLRSQTCLDLIADLYKKSSDIQGFRQRVYNLFVGNIVLTKYNNRTYKVDDVVWDQSPDTSFDYRIKGETRISYYDYYKQHYEIEIKDRNQPMFLHRSKVKPAAGTTEKSGKELTEVICLVPELCFLTGLTDEMRADMAVKKELSGHTRLTPSQRHEQLRKLVNEIRSTPAAYEWITNWNLELDADLTTLEGRALPMEKLIFAKREVETDFRCDWTRACAMEECLRAVDMRQWMCVYPGNRESTVAKFVELACEVGVKIGVRINMPMTVPLSDDRPDSYYQEIKRRLCDGLQIVVIVLPMLSDSRYTRVKRLLCVENAIPSQVVVLKTISKPDNVLRTVAQKIVLQMNCKLGGELWRVSIPIKKIMIVGIDVYHKVEQKYKSIAGFVSSLNPEQTRWYSRVCFQMTGQELADTLKTAFLQSIKKYREANGYLPEKIFIFRDGVSEGQLSTVADHEVAQFRSCFTDEFCPQIAVIVVQKRISTRMFVTVGGQSSNPKPGGIIDANITGRDSYDFFLVSQHVTQGTVTPTHYVVAYDDTNYKPDYIQRLSYKMTHMYYNWSGTIRVPAPCQYAHKLAFLTGQYLQNEADERLCDRLFFL